MAPTSGRQTQWHENAHWRKECHFLDEVQLDCFWHVVVVCLFLHSCHTHKLKKIPLTTQFAGLYRLCQPALTRCDLMISLCVVIVYFDTMNMNNALIVWHHYCIYIICTVDISLIGQSFVNRYYTPIQFGCEEQIEKGLRQSNYYWTKCPQHCSALCQMWWRSEGVLRDSLKIEVRRQQLDTIATLRDRSIGGLEDWKESEDILRDSLEEERR